jgi:hypothetical protein
MLRHLTLGHHHEACWLFWLAVVCDLNIHRKVIDEIPRRTNQHLAAMAVTGFQLGKCKKPPVRFKTKLGSDTDDWLLNLVSRSTEFTKASFGGCFADECEHFGKRKIRLIDFNAHMIKVAKEGIRAISNVRFGYEDEEDEEDGFDDGGEVDDYPVDLE